MLTELQKHHVLCSKCGAQSEKRELQNQDQLEINEIPIQEYKCPQCGFVDYVASVVIDATMEELEASLNKMEKQGDLIFREEKTKGPGKRWAVFSRLEQAFVKLTQLNIEVDIQAKKEFYEILQYMQKRWPHYFAEDTMIEGIAEKIISLMQEEWGNDG